jgi:phosphate transport system substrate-binding protein
VTTPAPLPGPGCVDIARASSKAATTSQDPAGLLVYIPYALDDVAVTTGGTTNIAHADGFSVAQLQSLYNCNAVTVGGVTYDGNNPVLTTGNQHVNLYIPQSGSGTRNFWATTMGISNTTLPACVHDVIQAGPNATQAVEEHDGTAYQSDPDGFGPFSVAQWIAQSNGINDRRHGAVLHNLATTAAPTTPISPFTASGTLNPAYPISREVYNVVQFSSVSGASADPNLVSLLVGPTSFLCSHPGTILHFGFGLLNSSPLGHTCGAVASDLRAFLVL